MGTIMRFCCAAFVAIFSAVTSAQGPLRLIWNPDSIESDPSLKAFYQKLTIAVNSHDANQLMPLLAARVLIGEEIVVSKSEAIKGWGLDRASHPSWRVLIGAVRLGGTVVGPRFVMPFHGGSPWISLDADWCLATSNVVPVRAKPSLDAPEIFLLDHHVIRYMTDSDDWHMVYLNDGRRGYVDVGDCIGAVGLHIEVTKQNGEWRITVLSGGD
jgi:hypothetical protein